MMKITDQCRIVQNRTVQNSPEQNRTEQSRTVQFSPEQNIPELYRIVEYRGGIEQSFLNWATESHKSNMFFIHTVLCGWSITKCNYYMSAVAALFHCTLLPGRYVAEYVLHNLLG